MALYRKYRSVDFNDLIGQNHITSVLKAQMSSGDISHAYLFTGPRGIGKTSLARIIAKAANCQNITNGNPCNKCEFCVGINKDTMTDVVEIDAASNNGVENIRELRSRAVYTPSVLKYRVYIVDEVHMLSIGAFNALLKILEEPPESVIFILATTESYKIPATIISRCLRFELKRISPTDIAARVKHVCEQENLKIDEGAARLIGILADGAMRDALSILDVCKTLHPEIDETAVKSSVGLCSKAEISNLAKFMLKKDVSSALNLIQNLSENGADIARLAVELLNYLRDLMVVKSAPQADVLVAASSDEIEVMQKIAADATLQEIIFVMNEVRTVVEKLRNGINPKILLEIMTAGLCVPAPVVSAENSPSPFRGVPPREREGQEPQNSPTPPRRDTEHSKAEGPGEVPKPSSPPIENLTPPPLESEIAQPPPPPTAPPPSKGNNADTACTECTKWSEIITLISSKNRPMGACLVGSRAFIQGDLLLIDCKNSLFSDLIKVAKNRDEVRKCAAEILGKDYRLGPYKGEAVPTKPETDPLDNLQNKLDSLNI